jgi:hypothetical protein
VGFGKDPDRLARKDDACSDDPNEGMEGEDPVTGENDIDDTCDMPT